VNPIQRWIQRQAEPLIEAALERGRAEGELTALSESWQSTSVFDTGAADTDHVEAHPTRGAYDRLPLFAAAVDTLASLVLGTGVTYGELDDPRAMTALEAWYALNDVENLSKQMFVQWLLDGELLALIAQDASRNEAAWVNLWDTLDGSITINTAKGNPRLVTSIRVGTRTLQPHEFAWRAAGTLFNRTRGRSPVRTAVEAAQNFTRLGEVRRRAHEIRGRLNAIYYALARDGRELAAKAARYRNLPRDGNVVTLQMNDQGQSERLEFTNLNTAAADADADTRTYIRTVAMVFGIPEHFLSVGDTGNRATADSMAEPMVRRVEEHQTFMEGFLAELFRKELIRRFGRDATFTVNTSELQSDGTRVNGTIQVPASELHIPFSFPPIRDDKGHDLDRVRFALEQNLISSETAVEALGFDPALELERKGAQDAEPDTVDPPAE